MEERQLKDVVVEEAWLLDTRNHAAWLSLFTEDCEYWIPLLGDRQVDAISYNSIAYDNMLLLRLRIERLGNPRAHSQRPPSRCQHILQQPVIVSSDAVSNQYVLRTPFLYVESCGEHQVTLAGTAWHTLVRVGDAFKILRKRINLLDAETALPAIQLFI